jgi:hypothetical protein
MDYLPNRSQPGEPSPHLSVDGLRRKIPDKARRLAIWLCLVRRLHVDEVLEYLEALFLDEARRISVRSAKRQYWLQVLQLAVFLAGGGTLWRIVDLIRTIVRLYTGW